EFERRRPKDMSRVHDALRRAEQLGQLDTGETSPEVREAAVNRAPVLSADYPPAVAEGYQQDGYVAAPEKGDETDWANLLSRVQEIPLHIAPEAHLINLDC